MGQKGSKVGLPPPPPLPLPWMKPCICPSSNYRNHPSALSIWNFSLFSLFLCKTRRFVGSNCPCHNGEIWLTCLHYNMHWADWKINICITHLMLCCQLIWCCAVSWFDVVLSADLMLCCQLIWCCAVSWFDVVLSADLMLCCQLIWCCAVSWFDVVLSADLMLCCQLIWCCAVSWFDVVLSAD